MNRGITVYGGTFNPPHLGHLESYNYLRKRGDVVIVVPAIAHEHKPEALTSALHREEQCRLMFGSRMLPLERYVLRQHPLPICTIEVLRMVRKLAGWIFDAFRDEHIAASDAEHPYLVAALNRYPHGETCMRYHSECPVRFAVGPDIDVNRWTGIDEIRRESFERVVMPEVPGVRSSYIRELIATGRRWEQYVTPQVAEYIRHHKLHGYKAV